MVELTVRAIHVSKGAPGLFTAGREYKGNF